MLNTIDLNKLNVFFVVMQSESLSHAAEKINVSRSAVSQAISNLEGQLGYALFLRKAQKIYPTEKAEQIYNELIQYQKNLDFILHKNSDNTKQVSGIVKVGAYDDFAKTYLSRCIQSFQSSHPNITFQLNFASPSQLQSMLENNRLDMCFSIFPSKGIKSIVSKKIYAEDLVLIAPIKFKKECKRYSTLIQLPVIDYFPKHILFKRWLFKHYKKRISKPKVKVFASSSEMVLQCIADGLGIGIVPDYVYEKRRESLPQCVKINPSKDVLKDFIWLNQHKNQFSSPAHKKFSEFAKYYFDSFIE